MNLKEIKSNAVPILWDNLDINDIILECRSVWSAPFPIIEAKIFEELAENYVGERPDYQIKAFGQELTTFGYNLCNIADKDDDNLLLVIVKEKNIKECIRICKKEDVLCQIFKQQGRKKGENARKVNPKEKMECETHQIPKNHNIKALAGNFAFGRTSEEPEKSFAIDLTEDFNNISYYNQSLYDATFSKQTGYYAILIEKSRNKYIIKIGKNPRAIKDWQELNIPNEIKGNNTSSMSWIADKLYIGSSKTAYEISMLKKSRLKKLFSTKNKKWECKTLLHTNEDSGYMYFTQLGNKTIYFSGSVQYYSEIYSYKQDEVKKCNYQKPANSFLKMVANGENNAYYCQMSVDKRDNFISVLLDVNFSTRKYKYRKLKNIDEWAYVKKFNDDWISIATSSGGHTKNKDLIQLWNPLTDEFLRLKVGAFGKYNLYRVHILSNKTIIIITASPGLGYQIRKPKDFWTFMEKNKLTPNDWGISNKIYPEIDF